MQTVAICGYLELLRDSGSLPEREQGLAAMSYEKAMKLKDMTDDLFKYFLMFGSSRPNMELEDYDAGILMEQLMGEAEFDLLDAGFVECFEKAAPDNPLKAEYLLPIYIDELLHAGKVSVKVLPTHDKWFGVTYAEDKQIVIDSFAQLIADGVYRKALFSDLKK